MAVLLKLTGILFTRRFAFSDVTDYSLYRISPYICTVWKKRRFPIFCIFNTIKQQLSASIMSRVFKLLFHLSLISDSNTLHVDIIEDDNDF